MHGVSSTTLLEGGWGCCTRSDRLWTFSRDTGGTLWSIASFFTSTYKYLHTCSHVHSTRSRLDWSIGAFIWVLLCYKCQARPANDHERPEFGPRARGGGIFNCRGVLEPHLRAKYLHPPPFTEGAGCVASDSQSSLSGFTAGMQLCFLT